MCLERELAGAAAGFDVGFFGQQDEVGPPLPRFGDGGDAVVDDLGAVVPAGEFNGGNSETKRLRHGARPPGCISARERPRKDSAKGAEQATGRASPMAG